MERKTVAHLVQRFETTGSVADLPRSERPATVRLTENASRVVAAVANDSCTSSRRLSQELELSRSSVRRLLRDENLRPFHPKLVQGLSEDDFDRRLECCEVLLELKEEDEEIFDKIIWSDEAVFKLSGSVNRHNTVYYATENPHVLFDSKVISPGVCVWGGISAKGLIGPFFFEDTVTGQSYVQMLEEKFYPTVSGWPGLERTWFQHDGAPAHFSLQARFWLDNFFPQRWIGRRGNIEWAPRSPDLTPPDFFLWGVVKDYVYKRRPADIEGLKEKISEAFASINQEVCQKVCRSVEVRLRSCIAVGGGHIEID